MSELTQLANFATIGGGLIKGIGVGLQAGQYLAAAKRSRDITTFNIGAERQTLGEQLDDLSINLKNQLSQQRALAGKSGFAIESKSILQVMSGTINDFERAVLRAQVASRNRQRIIEYQGELAAHQARSKAFSGLFSSAASSVTNLIQSRF